MSGTPDNLLIRKLAAVIVSLFRDSAVTSFRFLRIMIPISIVTKILKDVGAVDQLGIILGPVMQLTGLPGSMGLVWATALITNLYGGIAVFAALAPDANLTVAQVTILTTMMLVAHGLPLELRIAQQAGPRLRMMLLLRMGGALLIGGILNMIYSHGQFLQQPNSAIWDPGSPDASWKAWTVSTLQTAVTVFVIILSLLLLMRILKRLGVTDFLTRLLEPVLRLLGMSREAAPVTIIGMILGLAYGGSLIIQEARSGSMSKRDIFMSLALMGLTHSVIEDTLLMAAIGGHMSGICWGRIAFSLVVVYVLHLIFRRMSDATFERYFFRPKTAPAPADKSAP